MAFGFHTSSPVRTGNALPVTRFVPVKPGTRTVRPSLAVKVCAVPFFTTT